MSFHEQILLERQDIGPRQSQGQHPLSKGEVRCQTFKINTLGLKTLTSGVTDMGAANGMQIVPVSKRI